MDDAGENDDKTCSTGLRLYAPNTSGLGSDPGEFSENPTRYSSDWASPACVPRLPSMNPHPLVNLGKTDLNVPSSLDHNQQYRIQENVWLNHERLEFNLSPTKALSEEEVELLVEMANLSTEMAEGDDYQPYDDQCEIHDRKDALSSSRSDWQMTMNAELVKKKHVHEDRRGKQSTALVRNPDASSYGPRKPRITLNEFWGVMPGVLVNDGSESSDDQRWERGNRRRIRHGQMPYTRKEVEGSESESPSFEYRYGPSDDEGVFGSGEEGPDDDDRSVHGTAGFVGLNVPKLLGKEEIEKVITHIDNPKSTPLSCLRDLPLGDLYDSRKRHLMKLTSLLTPLMRDFASLYYLSINRVALFYALFDKTIIAVDDYQRIAIMEQLLYIDRKFAKYLASAINSEMAAHDQAFTCSLGGKSYAKKLEAFDCSNFMANLGFPPGLRFFAQYHDLEICEIALLRTLLLPPIRNQRWIAIRGFQNMFGISQKHAGFIIDQCTENMPEDWH